MGYLLPGPAKLVICRGLGGGLKSRRGLKIYDDMEPNILSPVDPEARLPRPSKDPRCRGKQDVSCEVIRASIENTTPKKTSKAISIYDFNFLKSAGLA